MKSIGAMKRFAIIAGIAGVLALGLLIGVVGVGLVSTVFAQGPTPNQSGFPGYAACHNGTAVLDLLKMSAQDLLKERQAGKSLLDIAKAKGVDEAKLTGALMQPISAMHTWMGQTYGNQSYIDQMTKQMQDWIAKDIRESKFGTMTDFRLGLGGNGTGYGMMGRFNGPGGYGGMMGGFNGSNGFGGMMGGGGMMGRWR